MKKVSLPIDLLVALAQLEDKDLAFVLRSIISYASEGIVPSFSNATLKAFFSLFRSSIDDQRSASEKQSEINRENAKGKKSAIKKKESKVGSSSSKLRTDSGSVPEPADSLSEADDIPHGSDSQRIAETGGAPIALEAIEAVYPKLGSFRSESLCLWQQFSDETRRRAIDFIQTYIQQHPSVSEQFYLNQYLKAQPWDKQPS